MTTYQSMAYASAGDDESGCRPLDVFK